MKITTLAQMPKSEQNSSTLEKGSLVFSKPENPDKIEKTELKKEIQISSAETSISKIDTLGQTIDSAYGNFCENQQIPLTFPNAVQSFSEIKKIYEQLWQEKYEEEALQLKPKIDFYEKCIQEMNMKAETLTVQDVNNIVSFLKKPIEPYYQDEKFDEVYYHPDSSKLLGLASGFYGSGNYDSFGLLKKQRINHQNGDILYLKKKQDQIEYEKTGTITLSLKARVFDSFVISEEFKFKESKIKEMKQRIDAQKKSLPSLEKLIGQQYLDWNYKSYQICSTEELINLGYPKDLSIECHAVVFFHKKISS